MADSANAAPTARRAARGPGFNGDEVKQLLRLARRLLPASAEDWEALAREYSQQAPLAPRSGESLRRKFLKLGRRNASSRAHRIKQQIQRRAASSRAEPSGSMQMQASEQVQDQESGGSSGSEDSDADASAASGARRALDERTGGRGGGDEHLDPAAAVSSSTPVAALQAQPAPQTPTPPPLSSSYHVAPADAFRASTYSIVKADSPGIEGSVLSTPAVVDRWLALEERRTLLEEQRMALEQRRVAVEERRLRLLEQRMDAAAAEREQLLEALRLALAAQHHGGGASDPQQRAPSAGSA